MRKLPCWLLLLLPVLCTRAAEVGEFELVFVTPLTETQQAALQELVAEDPEAAAALASLSAEAKPLIGVAPTPLAVIDYEGLVNTDPKRIACVEKLQQVNVAATLFNYWQVTGDDAAAATLRDFILAWAQTYQPTGNDVNENKLFALFVAYQALRDTFNEEDRATVDAWLTRIGELHAKGYHQHRNLTNRFTKRLRILQVLGQTFDRPKWTSLAGKGYQRFISQSLRPDGTSFDLEHRDTLTYHNSALKPLLDLARGYGPAGCQWYAWESADGASVKKSVDYVIPYAKGELQREEWTNSKVSLDRERAAAGVAYYQPGKLYDPKNAYELMLLASCFDRSLLPLARQLSDAPSEQYPDWRTVVIIATANANGC